MKKVINYPKRITFRLTEDDKEDAEWGATYRGMDLSMFIREVIREEVQHLKSTRR